MTALTQAHCEACRADAPHVSDEELPVLLRQIPDWNIEVRDGIMQLEKVYLFKNFKHALASPMPSARYPRPKATIRLLTEWGQSHRDLVEPLDQGPAPQRLHHGGAHRRGSENRRGAQMSHFAKVARVPGDPILACSTPTATIRARTSWTSASVPTRMPRA